MKKKSVSAISKAPASVAKKPLAKPTPAKASSKSPAESAVKAKSHPKAKAIVIPKVAPKSPSKPKAPVKKEPLTTSASTPRAASKSKAEKQALAPPAVTGVVGVSTEKGIFLVAAATQDEVALLDFRLAVKEPFPRAIHVGAGKCRRATRVVPDPSSQPPRYLYLAFVAVPAPTPLEGALLYRARTPDKQEVFFSAATQKYQAFEADKLTRVLAALSDGFSELLPEVLGEGHPLAEQTRAIIKRKTEIEFWNATQQKVKDLLQKGQGPEALSILEPLVYVRTPHAQAEKLLGELLYSSAKKPEAAQEGPGQQALKQLMTETVLLQWYLKRQQIATDS